MTTKRSQFSRRDFLRMTAVGMGTLAGGRLLSACSPKPASPTAVPTAQATATSLATAAATPVPATAVPATAAPAPRPEIVKFYPAVPSKVVQTHHSGV